MPQPGTIPAPHGTRLHRFPLSNPKVQARGNCEKRQRCSHPSGLPPRIVTSSSSARLQAYLFVDAFSSPRVSQRPSWVMGAAALADAGLASAVRLWRACLLVRPAFCSGTACRGSSGRGFSRNPNVAANQSALGAVDLDAWTLFWAVMQSGEQRCPDYCTLPDYYYFSCMVIANTHRWETTQQFLTVLFVEFASPIAYRPSLSAGSNQFGHALFHCVLWAHGAGGAFVTRRRACCLAVRGSVRDLARCTCAVLDQDFVRHGQEVLTRLFADKLQKRHASAESFGQDANDGREEGDGQDQGKQYRGCVKCAENMLTIRSYRVCLHVRPSSHLAIDSFDCRPVPLGLEQGRRNTSF